MGSNLQPIEAFGSITQKRLDDFDLLIDYSENKFKGYLENWEIPKIWFSWYPLAGKIKTVIKINEPVVYTSFWTRTQSIADSKLMNYTEENIRGPVVYPYRDPNIFKGYTGELASGLIVVNDFWNRKVFGAMKYQEMITIEKDLPIKIIGDYSYSFTKLLENYQKNRVFLELTEAGRPSTSTMGEAMTVGMPIIATSFGDFPILIRNDIEGFISLDPKEIIKCFKVLVNDQSKAQELGRNSRSRALEVNGETQFRTGLEEAFGFALKGQKWIVNQDQRKQKLEE
jgi:hypothetical protein